MDRQIGAYSIGLTILGKLRCPSDSNKNKVLKPYNKISVFQLL